MEQIDIKNGARSSCVLELVRLKAKEEEEGENAIFGTCRFVCRQQFVGVTVGVLDVKSLIEHDGKVRSVESVLFLRYFHFCNVLCILCNIRAIPTYRVYRLYDKLSGRYSNEISLGYPRQH